MERIKTNMFLTSSNGVNRKVTVIYRVFKSLLSISLITVPLCEDSRHLTE